jgi:hypothetical protein
MRLRSPAEHYIKYLILANRQNTNDVIKERLNDERLDYISDRYLDKVRAALKPPAPFQPMDIGHVKSFKFINEERVNSLFHPTAAMKMAKRILEVPRAKEFVETMILVHVPLSAIAAYVTQHRKVYCTAEAVQLYQHYFWNIDLLDTAEMRILFALRFEQAGERDPDLKDRKKLLTTAYYKDARKLAADLPYSPMSATLAQMRLGVSLNRGELSTRMMEARDIAVARAIEAVQQDGPGDHMKFLNYINGGRIIEEMLQMIAKPADHLQELQKKIALRTETRKMLTVHELSGGHHTVEMAPIEDAHEGTGQDLVGQGDLSGSGLPG